MKNLTFSSPFVAQETVNLLNCSAFIIPPGTSINPLRIILGGFFFSNSQKWYYIGTTF